MYICRKLSRGDSVGFTFTKSGMNCETEDGISAEPDGDISEQEGSSSSRVDVPCKNDSNLGPGVF